MKNIAEIAKEQGIDVISLANIDDVLLNTNEKFIEVSKRHMALIILYFLSNYKEYYPKEYVQSIVETGIISSLFGIRLIVGNESKL